MQKFFNKILSFLNIVIIYRFGSAIGDQLCMTALVDELSRNKVKVITIADFSEFFYNNKNVYINLHLKKGLIKRVLKKILDKSQGTQILRFAFTHKKYKQLENFMRATKSSISLIEAHSKHFNKAIDYSDLKPKIYFSEKEILEYEKKFNDLPDNFSIVQPIGKTSYTPNKEWGFNKFQTIINETNINWIQTGLKGDLVLNDVIDYTSKTKTVRELAYLISKADFVFCLEGLLNHLAAAVNTKSIVVFSGFSYVSLANYSTTYPIYIKNLDCSPCWILEKCPLEYKKCTEDINIEDVLRLIVDIKGEIK